MADPLQFNTPFNFKNFLASKGTSGLESIFKYVPDKMKISILQAMHKMHPTQAENFMVKLYNEYVSKLGTGADTNKNYYRWLANKIQPNLAAYDIGLPLPLEGPWAGGQDTGYTNINKIPLDHVKKLRLQLSNPDLDAGTRKMIEDLLRIRTTDAGKYNMALIDQLEKSGVKTITSISPEGVDMGKSILIDDTTKGGEVIDFHTRKHTKIINPLDHPDPKVPNKLMVPKSSLPFLPRKPIPPGQKMTRVPPVPKGIPWSNIGMRILNNPFTRTAGWLGNVALGATTLSDVFFGTDVGGGSMARDINKWMYEHGVPGGVPSKNSPTDRQGNVIHSVPTYRNLQNVAQRDVLNPNEMRGVTSFDTTRYNPHAMNAGGIVSLML